jgi:hypothetical protein
VWLTVNITLVQGEVYLWETLRNVTKHTPPTHIHIVFTVDMKKNKDMWFWHKTMNINFDIKSSNITNFLEINLDSALL